MEAKRSSFSGKIGFILAAAGSAVGLGNIWRFPYLAAKYGGGIFLLVYLVLAVTFGFALMCAEIAIGRKTGQSAVNAFGRLDKRFGFIGILGSVVPILILPYYCVIGGWVIKYFAVFVSGNMDAAAGNVDGIEYFKHFISLQNGEPIGWFLLFLALTALVILLGVDKGIEKLSKILMPVLIVLTLGIAIYTMTINGALEGVRYYIVPDFTRIESWKEMAETVLAAMGQLFYSMSLAMGIMITYGSYMKKDVSIEKSVRSIELFDTGIAFLAGLTIVPAVYAFSNGDPDAMKKGAGLMFIVLPKVFQSIGPVIGTIIGTSFFILVFLAALTSSISLMETVVSIFRDKFGWNRTFTCVIVFIICIVLGLLSCFGYSIFEPVHLGNENLSVLDLFDFVTNNLIMPIVAFFTCIFIGYIIKPKTICDEISLTGKFKSQRVFEVIIKYIAPIFVILILIFSSLETLGFWKI